MCLQVHERHPTCPGKRLALTTLAVVCRVWQKGETAIQVLHWKVNMSSTLRIGVDPFLRTPLASFRASLLRWTRLGCWRRRGTWEREATRGPNPKTSNTWEPNTAN